MSTPNIDDIFDGPAPNATEFSHLVHALENESERGVALVACGIMEQLLEELLRAKLVSNAGTDRLLKGPNAPLGTLSARIDACHALGLISDIERHNLEILRRIRNDFAHKPRVSFADDSIADRCANLKMGEIILGTNSDGTKATVPPRGRFQFIAMGIVTLHREAVERALKKKCKPRIHPSEFNDRKSR